jgi:hypothetical protein
MMAFFFLPMVAPMQMQSLELSGVMQGIILLTPILFTVVVLPAISRLIPVIGLENSIVYSNIVFALSLVLVGFGLCCE